VTLVDTVGVVSFSRGFPLAPTPLPEGRGASGLVVWGGTAMSWHRGGVGGHALSSRRR
jgi:hypothetical protein